MEPAAATSQSESIVNEEAPAGHGDAEDAPEVCATIVIEALRRGAHPGDISMIPSIEAILRHGVGAVARSRQPVPVRLAALEALRVVTPPFPKSWPGLPTVVQLLCWVCSTDSALDVRREALCVLRGIGVRGERELISTCQSLMLNPAMEEDFRAQAADALKSFVLEGDPASLQASMAALRDPCRSIWSHGLDLLQMLLTPGCAARFTWILEDLAGVAASHADFDARASVYKYLPLVADKSSRAAAIHAATDGLLGGPTSEVRMASLAALRRLWPQGDPDAMATLTIVVHEGGDVVLRCAALDALAAVADREGQAAAGASLHCARLLEDREDCIRSGALRALKRLGAYGDDKVVGELVRLLKHRYADVVVSAAEALSSVASRQDKQAVMALEALRDSMDVEESLRYAASQALKTIR